MTSAENRSSSNNRNNQETSDELDSSDSSSSPGTIRQQRRRILLHMLFRHIISNRNSSNSDDSESETETNPDTALEVGPLPPLRFVRDEDALAQSLQCRFCFEGPLPTATSTSTTTSNNNERNRLIAPCNCSGGSEWVHLHCLRKWQRQAAITSYRRNAGSICNVCTSRYLVPPLPPPTLRNDLFPRGTLLVALDAGGSFHRSVVMLLNDADGETGGSRSGIIINSESTEHGRTTQMIQRALPQQNPTVQWRRGGPVYGGRLGVVRYMVAHTFNDGESNNSRGNSSVISLPVFDENGHQSTTETGQSSAEVSRVGGVKLVYNSYDRECPATFSREELSGVFRKLKQRLRRRSSHSAASSSSQEMHSTAENGTVILFTGCCRWGRGQLEGEVQRGLWGVCSGTMNDVLQNNNANLWDEISNGDRMLTTQQLYTGLY